MYVKFVITYGRLRILKLYATLEIVYLSISINFCIYVCNINTPTAESEAVAALIKRLHCALGLSTHTHNFFIDMIAVVFYFHIIRRCFSHVSKILCCHHSDFRQPKYHARLEKTLIKIPFHIKTK